MTSEPPLLGLKAQRSALRPQASGVGTRGRMAFKLDDEATVVIAVVPLVFIFNPCPAAPAPGVVPGGGSTVTDQGAPDFN